jgi:hypothetical protein
LFWRIWWRSWVWCILLFGDFLVCRVKKFAMDVLVSSVVRFGNVLFAGVEIRPIEFSVGSGYIMFLFIVLQMKYN